jgi:hypothetical protein
MSTFTATIDIGTRGASLLSFDFSGCTGYNPALASSNVAYLTGCTSIQTNVSYTTMGSGRYISFTGLTYDPIQSQTKWIHVKVNNIADGSATTAPECQNLFQNIQIANIPTYTPTPTPSPTPSPTPTSTNTLVPTYTPTSTPTPTTVTNTPTPSPTPASTYTPTPTNTPNVTIDPTNYYYYAMGDCSDMKYSGYTSTITGFGPPIVLPVCMNYQEVADFYSTNNFAMTNLVIDYNAPCGFGSGYTAPRIAQSSVSYDNETVFNVGGACWSVIEANPAYVTGWTINLDTYTPYSGTNACYVCIGESFTGFTYYQYTAEKCSDGSPTYVYTIFPYNPSGSIFNYNTGDVYYLANHDIDGNITEQYCATITGYVGEYSGPTWSDGFTNWPVGPLTCGGPYGNCTAGDCLTGRTDCYDMSMISTPTPTPDPTAPTSTPVPTTPIIASFGDNIQYGGECYNPGSYEETHYPSATFASAALVGGTVRFTYSDTTYNDVVFSIGSTSVDDTPFTCGCNSLCINLTNAVVL